MKQMFLNDAQEMSFEQTREKGRFSDYSVTKFFVNRLPNDIYIRNRSNIIVKIRPQDLTSTFDHDALYVCERISCQAEQKKSFIRQVRQTSEREFHYFHNAILKHWDAEFLSPREFGVDVSCKLTRKELEEHNGVIYLYDHDIVVMYGIKESEMEKIHHPYSIPGAVSSMYEKSRIDNPYLRGGDFTMNIRIIDNSGTLSPKWCLTWDDEPFLIRPMQDADAPDGIYVTYSKNVGGMYGEKKLLAERYEFKDYDKLTQYRLYNSEHEALAHRRDNQSLDYTTKIQIADANARKAEIERANLEREAQLREEKHRQDVLKIRKENERLINEHSYQLEKLEKDKKLQRLKNTSDVIKCIPVVASTLLSLAYLFKKK